MLRGGVRPGSITMLLGSSGSGKTLLGMQFLSEGLKRGERVVYFGFYEHPRRFWRNASASASAD